MIKKIIKVLLLTIIIITIFYLEHYFVDDSTENEKQETITDAEPVKEEPTPYVSYNGWLKVNGTSILNEKDENFRLRGISSHGIQWFSDIITKENLETLKNDWGINVFRIAMYTNEDGYISNPDKIKEKVINIADMVIDLDMYVVIDWHILSDGNPMTYKEQSKVFFNEISELYKDTPNVIYEICNEPNTNPVTWDNQVKPYAEEIIPIIRKNSPNSIIIVGTPNWSQRVDKAADNPLNFDNILYSLHFYAGTHGEDLRYRIDYALERNLPIIVSEWGTTDLTGNGPIYIDKANEWIKYLDEKNISWINWSFSNKAEGSAILVPEYQLETNIDNSQNVDNSNNNVDNSNNTVVDSQENVSQEIISPNINDYLTESGKYVKSLFKGQ